MNPNTTTIALLSVLMMFTFIPSSFADHNPDSLPSSSSIEDIATILEGVDKNYLRDIMTELAGSDVTNLVADEDLTFAFANYIHYASDVEKIAYLQNIKVYDQTYNFSNVLIDNISHDLLVKILVTALHTYPAELVEQTTLDELRDLFFEIPDETLIPTTAFIMHVFLSQATNEEVESFLSVNFSYEDLSAILGEAVPNPEIQIAIYLKSLSPEGLGGFLTILEQGADGSTAFILANIIIEYPEGVLGLASIESLTALFETLPTPTIQDTLRKIVGDNMDSTIFFDEILAFSTSDEIDLLVAYALLEYSQQLLAGVFNAIDYITPTPVSAITDGEEFTALAGARGITTIEIGGTPYALVASSLDNAVQIIDITNPHSPIAVTTIVDGEDGFTELASARYITTITIEGTPYALVTAKDDNGVQIIDITDPYFPLPVASGIIVDGANGFTELSKPIGITTVVIGGTPYALVASLADDAVQMIDISDPYDPLPVENGGIIDVSKGGMFTGLNGAHSITTITDGGNTYALVTSYYGDAVQIIDITIPSAPTAVSAIFDNNVDHPDSLFTELEGAAGITTVTIGTHTYALVAADYDDGVQIIDITNLHSPMPVANGILVDETNGFTGLIGPTGITTVTIDYITYALVTGHYDDAVQIIDITIPSAPIAVTTLVYSTEYPEIDRPSGITTITIGGTTYALVASLHFEGESGGVQIIDLTSGPLPDGYTPPVKKGGGCSGDCTPPTFGNDENNKQLVQGGFSYNDQAIDVTEFWTPYELVTAQTGEVVNFTIKAYENNGLNNIKWFQFGIVPEVGTPLNDAEILATFYLESSKIAEIVEEEKYDLFDIVAASTYIEECGYITSDCLELSIDVMFNEELINKVIVIDVIDLPRNSNTKYLNDGIDTVGESMNKPLISSVPASSGGVFYPQERGAVELTLTSYKNSEWQDEYGYMWEEDFDNHTFRIISDVPQPQREADLMWSAMTRMNSNFEIIKDYEEKRAIYYVFDASKLVSELPDSWTYELPKSEALQQLELAERIELEKNRVSDMMDSLFPYQRFN